jgi:hypothetical protein
VYSILGPSEWYSNTRVLVDIPRESLVNNYGSMEHSNLSKKVTVQLPVQTRNGTFSHVGTRRLYEWLELVNIYGSIVLKRQSNDIVIMFIYI